MRGGRRWISGGSRWIGLPVCWLLATLTGVRLWVCRLLFHRSQLPVQARRPGRPHSRPGCPRSSRRRPISRRLPQISSFVVYVSFVYYYACYACLYYIITCLFIFVYLYKCLCFHLHAYRDDNGNKKTTFYKNLLKNFLYK